MRLKLRTLSVMLAAVGCTRVSLPPEPDTLGWARHVPHGPSSWPHVEPGAPFLDMPWPMSSTDARIILTRAHTFGGAGDTVSPHLVAFNVLLDQSNAREEFEGIARTGTPAGQLYALCGLQLLESTQFNALRERLYNSTERMETSTGHVGVSASVSEMAKGIEIHKTAASMRAARGSLYSYVDWLANNRLNAPAPTVTGVAASTPAPAAAAR